MTGSPGSESANSTFVSRTASRSPTVLMARPLRGKKETSGISSTNAGTTGIWLATSKDKKVWTNVQDEPVLSPGPGEYDKDQVAFNQIIRHKGRYYAYYHGSAKTGPKKGLWSTNIATSADLIHWEKFAGNPLLPIEANHSSGIVVHDGKQFRLYTMHPAVHLYLPAK